MTEFRIRGKQPGRRPHFEIRFGDSVQRSTGIMMELFRRIDRGENRYEERIVNSVTGEVVREKAEPLSEHRDHGDARRRS